MTQTSRKDPVRNREDWRQATRAMLIINSEQRDLPHIPRAKAHGETTNLCLAVQAQKLAQLFRRNAIILIFYVANLDTAGISQRWEDHQQRQEWRPEDWQDQRCWEREQTPTMTKRTLVLAPGNCDEPCFFDVVQLVQVSLLACRPLLSPSTFSSEFRVQVVATAMHATVSVHRTPPQTHSMRTFFHVQCTHFHQCTCIGSRSLSVSQKSSHLWFHVSLSLVFLTLTSRLSAHPTYLVSDHDDCANWNPNKLLCNFGQRRAWPNGWLDLKQIHHTSDFSTILSCGNTAQHCRLGVLQDSDFAGDLEDSTSTSGGGEDFMYSRKSIVRLHELDVQEANVIVPTVPQNLKLFRWMLVWEWTGYRSWLVGCCDGSVTFIEEYRITNPWSTRKLLANSQIQTQTEGKPRCWWIVKCGSCCHKRKLSHCEAQLSIFEDNEAVIKMIIKGRRPTMRYVSRTHRVAFVLVWQDQFGLPKIQIKSVDTKNQLADMLTKDSFHVWWMGPSSSLVHFTLLDDSCSHLLWDTKQSVMSKRCSRKEGPKKNHSR